MQAEPTRDHLLPEYYPTSLSRRTLFRMSRGPSATSHGEMLYVSIAIWPIAPGLELGVVRQIDCLSVPRLEAGPKWSFTSLNRMRSSPKTARH